MTNQVTAIHEIEGQHYIVTTTIHDGELSVQVDEISYLGGNVGCNAGCHTMDSTMERTPA